MSLQFYSPNSEQGAMPDSTEQDFMGILFDGPLYDRLVATLDPQSWADKNAALFASSETELGQFGYVMGSRSSSTYNDTFHDLSREVHLNDDPSNMTTASLQCHSLRQQPDGTQVSVQDELEVEWIDGRIVVRSYNYNFSEVGVDEPIKLVRYNNTSDCKSLVYKVRNSPNLSRAQAWEGLQRDIEYLINDTAVVLGLYG